jgi:hypothetical protein
MAIKTIKPGPGKSSKKMTKPTTSKVYAKTVQPKPVKRVTAGDSNIVQKINKRVEDKVNQGRNKVIGKLKAQDAKSKTVVNKINKKYDSTYDKVQKRLQKMIGL